MINIPKIQTGLSGLVAVNQPLNPAYNVLLPAQYVASSGLYLDSVEHFRFEFWMDAQSYAGADNSELQSSWDKLQKSAIANVVNTVFSRSDYIDRNLIYKNTFDRNQFETLTVGKFYGYEIEVSSRKNLAFKITRVLIEGLPENAGTNIDIHLYNSAQAEPLYSETITLAGGTTQQVESLEWYVDNSDNTYKGKYFVGFHAPDDAFKPYKRDYDNASMISHITELEIEPIERTGDFSDLDNIGESNVHCGMNFDITVYEDYTDLAIQNKDLFAKAIQLQWAMQVLLGVLSTPRSNRNERISKEMMAQVVLAVEGQKGFGLQRFVGLRENVNGELNKLSAEVKNLIDGYFETELTVVTKR